LVKAAVLMVTRSRRRLESHRIGGGELCKDPGDRGMTPLRLPGTRAAVRGHPGMPDAMDRRGLDESQSKDGS